MNSFSTRALVCAGAAALAVIGAASVLSVPAAAVLVSVVLAAAFASVAFAAQSERLRGDERLVYRPVYVRRHDVQRRVRSGDE